MTAPFIVVILLLAVATGRAEAEPWRAAYRAALPDDAFAVVEARPDGRRVRHLPHHAAEGRLDHAHLRSALARLPQVKWADPESADRAARHLREHLEEPRGQKGSR